MSLTRNRIAPTAKIMAKNDGAEITLLIATQLSNMIAPRYTTPNALNAGFAVILPRIQIINAVVRTTPAITLTILNAESGKTAIRYKMCPARNTKIPTRKINCPFFSNTNLRLSRMSAMHPTTSPATIISVIFGLCDALLKKTPMTTKQSDANPFNTTAATYFFTYST